MREPALKYNGDSRWPPRSGARTGTGSQIETVTHQRPHHSRVSPLSTTWPESTIDGLDTKAAALLGFTGVVRALLFTSETVSANWNGAFTVAAIAFSLGVLALGAGGEFDLRDAR